MLNRALLASLIVALCSSVALGGIDVEAKILRPAAIEPPGLVPVTVRLTNHGDTALVESLHATISDGYSSFTTGVPLRPGQVKLEYMPVPWVCPADSEETCKAWITCPADSNHSNDTDVVIINSTWQRTYDGGHGSDGGRSVTWHYGPGFVTTGWTYTSAGDIDVYLVKTNEQGDTVWTRTYGGTGTDVGNSVQQIGDQGYIIAGRTWSFGAGSSDFYLVRIDSLGDTLWTRAYGGPDYDEANSIETAADSGFIVAGTTHSSGSEGGVYVVRTDAQGDTLWTRTYSGTSALSVQRAADLGFVIAGSNGLYDDTHVYLLRIDAHGDTLWTRTYDEEDAVGNSVQLTADVGYVIAGSAMWSSDVLLIKTDSSGVALWTRTYGGTGDDVGEEVQQTWDGGYIIAGRTTSFGAGREDVYLVKADSSGDTLWTRTYGGTASDAGYSVQALADGSSIVAGHTGSFGAGDSDVYLIRTRGLLDVGPVAILSPPRVADFGSVYTPRVAVGNFGLTSGMLQVTMNIGSDYSRTVQETLVSKPLDTLEFPPWIAVPAGSSSITCFTSLAGDEHPTNDTIRDSVLVLRTRDVAATAILSPPGIAESGSAYLPRTVVLSFGTSLEAFPVTMNIGTGYTHTMQETLVSGQCDTVVFPAWTADPLGPLDVTCFTSLTGDEDPANDTIRDSIQVVPPPHHDVGAVAIIAPSGSVRAGDTVVPRMQIRNFGNRVERYFDVRFRIGTNYNEKVNVTDALPPGSTEELTFPPWIAESDLHSSHFTLHSSSWAVSCSTMLGSDENRTNDKVSSSVEVYVQSLSIAPDQSDRLQAGQSKACQFYALIGGETSGVIELARPSPPPGWNLRLSNAAGTQDLTDTDGDGLPDLGYVMQGESSWFSLDVTAPPGTQGDTASLGHVTIPVAGNVGGRPDIADTVVLSLTLVPAFSVHNFPNPFSDHTTFAVGLPEDGKASLTVYTRAGERVCRVLTNAFLPAGVHLVRWDGVNDHGRSIAPGTYEYLLDYVHSGKIDRIRKRLVVTRE